MVSTCCKITFNTAVGGRSYWDYRQLYKLHLGIYSEQNTRKNEKYSDVVGLQLTMCSGEKNLDWTMYL